MRAWKANPARRQPVAPAGEVRSARDGIGGLVDAPLPPRGAARGPWRQRALLGVAAPLLFAATPVSAASLTGVSIATSVGFALALWAMLVERAFPPISPAVFALAAGVVVAGFGWRYAHRGSRRRRCEATLQVASASMRSLLPRGVDKPQPETRPALPACLDRETVLDAARTRFIGLQAAWDRGDVHALRSLTTPPMLDELLVLLAARGQAPNRTEVLTLDAELLGVDEIGASYLAGVEFSGLIRECASQGAVPFRELWLLAASKDDADSWRLARQQALF
jgi:predicted lipid-binding transport protein (Tim44 family)